MKIFAVPILTVAALLLAWQGPAAAQTAQGDDVVINGDFQNFTPIMSGFTGGLLYRVPEAWACTNYPRLAKACTYEPGRASIASVPAGNTVTSRMAYPVNPTWWQTVQVPVAGTYTLTADVTKVGSGINIRESYYQAVVIKDSLKPLLNVPHAQLPVGVKTPITTTVTLTAGTHYLYLGLAVRTTSGSTGYRYDFNNVTLTYAGY